MSLRAAGSVTLLDVRSAQISRDTAANNVRQAKQSVRVAYDDLRKAVSWTPDDPRLVVVDELAQPLALAHLITAARNHIEGGPDVHSCVRKRPSSINTPAPV